MKNFIKIACGLSLTFGLYISAGASEPCTFSDWRWDVNAGKAVDFQTVSTTKDQLSDEHFHPALPCSVCEEDMIAIKIGDLPPVKLCRVVAPAIEEALNAAIKAGFSITSLTGYRVGRTKGPVDDQGRRTQYSHHSFGLAIDINAQANGLYGNCLEFSPACV